MYAILINPGHNKVYYENSKLLALAEVRLTLNLDIKDDKIYAKRLGSIDYIVIDIEGLDDEKINLLYSLSFSYAVFKIIETDGEQLLLPVNKKTENFVDKSISSMLKYTGKTNEIFTRLMLNIGMATVGGKTNKMSVLDPIAGKGTTLYEGLVRGFDVYGIEIGGKVAEESYRFMKKYLETAKFKHSSKEIRQSGKNKCYTAVRYAIDITKDKGNKEPTHFEMIAANSVYANELFKKNSFDMIIGDLPYGVQHSNVTNEKQSGFTRNPRELLTACLPVWRQVLKPDGALVLGWNTNILDRDAMVKLFLETGFEVKNDGDYLEFAHKVDNAIYRDVIAAVKVIN